jgi:hypothetical protein
MSAILPAGQARGIKHTAFTLVNLLFPFVIALFARMFAGLLDDKRRRETLFERDLLPVTVRIAELHQLLKRDPHFVGDCSLLKWLLSI